MSFYQDDLDELKNKITKGARGLAESNPITGAPAAIGRAISAVKSKAADVASRYQNAGTPPAPKPPRTPRMNRRGEATEDLVTRRKKRQRQSAMSAVAAAAQKE